MNKKIDMQDIDRTNIARHVPDDEIDLIELAKTLWNGRKTVVTTTIVFMFIGLFIALFSEKEYTASTTMIPQSSDGGMKLGGNLGGLAAMAGINLGGMSGGSDIPPTLYPKIVESIPFQKELMNVELDIENCNEAVTFAYFYKELYRPSLLGKVKKYSIGLPGLILKAIRGKRNELEENGADDILSITQDEYKLIKRLNTQLSLEVNDKDGYVSISALMPEAKAAAQLAEHAQKLLQDAIIDFKSKKAKEQLAFIEQRHAEKKHGFEKIQEKLAHFRDRNRNITTAIAQAEFERLQAEYNLAQSVYSELAKQLETQKLQVKQDTPVFTIIEPVTIPLLKSAPKRGMILIIWLFLGGVVGVATVFAREFFAGVKEQWRKSVNANNSPITNA